MLRIRCNRILEQRVRILGIAAAEAVQRLGIGTLVMGGEQAGVVLRLWFRSGGRDR